MILLASGSPRRAELLRLIGVNFKSLSPDLDETPQARELPGDYVARLACEKAAAGWQAVSAGQPVQAALGADTAVVLDGRILGKPQNRQDHAGMMQLLGDTTHEVYSAVALANAQRTEVRTVVTEVSMRAVSSVEAARYWETGEPEDKAGGYAIQGLGSVFVKAIGGSYSAVVGLPLLETAELLDIFGVDYWLRRSVDE